MTARVPTASALAELVRLPAALTVVGDTLAGHAAGRGPVAARHLLLPAASACLHLAGMALNDWADRDLDAVERPERPIPSGRVTPAAALTTGAALTAAGVAAAGLATGRRGVAVASGIASGVWAYDTVLKHHAVLGPAAMAACRGLDVLLGATTGSLHAAAPAAAGLAAHTAAVTALSRGEVRGTTPAVAASVAGVTVAGALVPVAVARRSTLPATAAAALAYAATCLPGQLRAAAAPTASAARHATRSGLHAMIPLQATWAARSGRPVTALVLGGVAAAGSALRRRARTRGHRQVSIT
ncbi:SCO3242 family prenyltransferase [Myceligenerans xiligouense]|uniref:4-hydroxybenzoate polyprenyltransferase n=1 Tax=Myceligenerans xiligouense TaxID=253184 RepID=A0A3N4YLH9_9MICO|nr:UbiA family prenyltransferase [Myceligenerans xiligouense]RPF20296.1 4-hydroxybenzoate polyprenyltransferase [Myceligenerans xiligouense]